MARSFQYFNLNIVLVFCFTLYLFLSLSLSFSLSIPLCEKMFKIKLIWPWNTDCWKHSKTDPGQTLPSNKYWIIKQIWLGTRSRTKRSPVRLPQVCILKENLPFGPMCFSGWGIYLLNIWGCVNHIRLILMPAKNAPCGQSYKHFTLVNYDSRVVIWGIFQSGTTLES